MSDGEKKLKTLEEHNKSAFQKHLFSAKKDFLNGIECPLCKNELYEDGSVQTLSLPPQVPIFCKHCKYTGWRIL